MSCVMSTIAEPKSAQQLADSSRICAWTVTSSAVVGSSAISSDGIAGERHGDHRALAHAARELVRIVVDAPARVRDADLGEQLDARARAAALAPTFSCARICSAICQPIV